MKLAPGCVILQGQGLLYENFNCTVLKVSIFPMLNIGGDGRDRKIATTFELCGMGDDFIASFTSIMNSVDSLQTIGTTWILLLVLLL